MILTTMRSVTMRSGHAVVAGDGDWLPVDDTVVGGSRVVVDVGDDAAVGQQDEFAAGG